MKFFIDIRVINFCNYSGLKIVVPKLRKNIKKSIPYRVMKKSESNNHRGHRVLTKCTELYS